MCCCASRRGFIASPCRRCASRNSSANVCFCEGRSQKSTNRHPATPASLNSNTPPTNWNFDMLDFPRTALHEGGDPYSPPDQVGGRPGHKRSHRIPREHVAGTLERRQRRPKRALELLIESLRRPTLGAMDRADRPRLIEQEHLIVAHREDLPADPLGAIRRKIDDERSDHLRRHLLDALDAALLRLGLRRN